MQAKVCAITIISVLIVCGSWMRAQGAGGDPRNGQAIYEQQCLRCHGPKLDGNGPDSQYLVVAPANLTSARSRAKTDWELLVAITHGVAFSPMHAWKDRLTQDQVMDVLAYLRMIAPFDAVS